LLAKLTLICILSAYIEFQTILKYYFMNTHFIKIIYLLILTSPSFLIAQCTIDQSFVASGSSGIYPNMMPNGSINTLYNQSYTITTEDSIGVDLSNYAPIPPGAPIPTQLFQVGVDNVFLDSVIGLPNGLNISYCDINTCSWLGGASGCFVISGTPIEGGIFDVKVKVKYGVGMANGLNIPSQIPGIPIPIPAFNNKIGPSVEVSNWMLYIDTTNNNSGGSNGGGNNGGGNSNGNTSIDELDNFVDIQVYPNPVIDNNVHINIKSSLNDRFSLKVYDQIGAVIKSLSIENKQNINIGPLKLSQGFYFVEASYNNKRSIKKLIVQ
jgi:hypothetical protein